MLYFTHHLWSQQQRQIPLQPRRRHHPARSILWRMEGQASPETWADSVMAWSFHNSGKWPQQEEAGVSEKEARESLLVPWNKICYRFSLLFFLLGKSLPTPLGLSGTQSYAAQRRGDNLAGQSDDSEGPLAGDRDASCSPIIMNLHAHL